MRKKRIRKAVDEELLDAIFSVENEWKNIQSIVEKSIELSLDREMDVKIAQAKYMFLLNEARQREISAMRYPRP